MPQSLKKIVQTNDERFKIITTTTTEKNAYKDRQTHTEREHQTHFVFSNCEIQIACCL